MLTKIKEKFTYIKGKFVLALKLIFGFIILMTILLLLMVDSNNKKKLENGTCKMYKVVSSSLNIRSGQGSNFEILGKINKSEQICIDKIKSEWAHIENGEWVNKKYLKKVEAASLIGGLFQMLIGIIVVILFGYMLIKGAKSFIKILSKLPSENSIKSANQSSQEVKKPTEKKQEVNKIINIQKFMMSSPQKACALCQYWAGPRTLTNNNLMVEFDNNATGKCVGGIGFPKYNHEIRGMVHCNKFKKWSI